MSEAAESCTMRAWTTRDGTKSTKERHVWLKTVRLVMILALGILVAQLASDAQSPMKVHRIGVLSGSAPTLPSQERRQEDCRQALHDRGYVEGHNLAIAYRYAEEQFARLPDLAAELVRLKVDVVVAGGSEAVAAVKHATQTIPVVMTHVREPVQRGFVDSLARPGGNITGLSIVADDIAGKQLELLREVVPQLSRVVVLWNPPQPAHTPALKALEGLGRAWG